MSADSIVLPIPAGESAQAAFADRMGADAQTAARTLAILSTDAKNDALTKIHDSLAAARAEILAANEKDVSAARAAGVSAALVSRIDMSVSNKFDQMLSGVLDIVRLQDPIGIIDKSVLLDDGLVLRRSSCPIGVLFTIFEARPEVLTNVTCIALKSGNAIILKGGAEASATITALATAIRAALATTSVSAKAVQVVVGDRAETRPVVNRLLQLEHHIDLVIPRGGKELVSFVKKHSLVAVLGHADGICSAYLRADCPTELAVKVIHDSKTSYPAACNSIETLLVESEALAPGRSFAEVVRKLLVSGVTLYLDEPSKVVADTVAGELSAEDGKSYADQVCPVMPEHYNAEFLDLKLAVKTITRQPDEPEDRAVDLAIEHVNAHSSHHTDLILTANQTIATRYLAAIDSAGVYWNVSTRMADGHRYGFGAEVGISTNKIHARGPVGLDGLTIYKWLLTGQGQTSVEYNTGKRTWKHAPIRPTGLDNIFAEGVERL